MIVEQIKYGGPKYVYTEKNGNRYVTDMVTVVLNGDVFKMGYCKETDTLFTTGSLGAAIDTGVIEGDYIEFPNEIRSIIDENEV